MVDSFLKWSTRNPDRAKSLEEFVHDGLIAAAKRCESCLSEKLGVKFDKIHDADYAEEESLEADLEASPMDIVEAGTEALSEPAPEEPISYDESTEPIMEDGAGVSLDSVERIEDEEMGEIDVDGPQRDFSTDFELVEPTPLGTESSEVSEPEEEAIGAVDEIEDEEKPSFSWSDYESAVSPEPSVEEPDLKENESDDSGPESLAAEPEEPRVWSPYDEPSLPEEELTRETAEDDPSLDDTEDEAPITEPPAPPPPPESDEDEEERKRRARRLFFGA